MFRKLPYGIRKPRIPAFRRLCGGGRGGEATPTASARGASDSQWNTHPARAPAAEPPEPARDRRDRDRDEDSAAATGRDGAQKRVAGRSGGYAAGVLDGAGAGLVGGERAGVGRRVNLERGRRVGILAVGL